MKSVCLLLVADFSDFRFAADGKTVSYKSGDETVQGVLYTPEGKGPFPALFVIHEWWGLDDWVKEQASKLADQGYVALAIDLYRGKVATTPEEAHEIMRGVPEDRAAQDLRAAVAFLKSQSDVKKDRIGAIGWCMGGGYSLDVALQDPTLAADVINYGHLATDAIVEENSRSGSGDLWRKRPGHPCGRREEVRASLQRHGQEGGNP